MKAATLKSVALEAGLGRSTVGLILSGRGDEMGIAKVTQHKVLEVARHLGYRPNRLAMGLAGKRTQTIGLLVPSSSFFPQYLMPQELSLRLHRLGYQTYLIDNLHDPAVISESLAEMATRRVDGIVLCVAYDHMLTPPIREALHRFPVTVLVTNEPPRHQGLWSHIIFRNVAPAIDHLVDHFARIGRRRPIIATPVGPTNNEKILPFKAALERHGFDARDTAAVFDVGKNTSYKADVYTWFMERFESGRLEARAFDALFCSCDEGAAAAMNYLQRHGRRVPEDVAVVGLNNTPWIQGMQPPLASVSWGYPACFEIIESRLVERLKQPDTKPGCDDIPLEFVWRESAGPEAGHR